MPALVLQLIIGLWLSAAIAWVAYRRNSLSLSGAYAAVVVGTIIFALGGWPWGLLLVTFFVTSSVLSHYRNPQKEAVADHFAKSGRRDLRQVLANGGLAALLAALFALTGSSQPLLFVAFVGAIAAANADTWATELGVLSQVKPRLITTREQVGVAGRRLGHRLPGPDPGDHPGLAAWGSAELAPGLAAPGGHRRRPGRLAL